MHMLLCTFFFFCDRVADSFSSSAAFKSCLAGKAFSLYSTATVQGIVNAVCDSMGGMTDCQSCTAQSCAEPLGESESVSFCGCSHCHTASMGYPPGLRER